jgi:hypothetical protein
MKRLRQLDFLAPPGRPWVGYLLLTLAGTTLLALAWLIWQNRAPDGLDVVARNDARPPRLASGADPGVLSPSSDSARSRLGAPAASSPTASSPAAAGSSPAAPASADLAATPSDTAASARPADPGASATPVVSAQAVAALQPANEAYADAAALHEQFQLRQTRAIGGPLALPWVEVMQVLQSQLRSGIAILRIEPEATGSTPALLVRLTARASDDIRMRAFIDALNTDSRLHDVTLIAPVLDAVDGRPADVASAIPRRASAGLQFSLVLGWQGVGAAARNRASAATHANRP